MATKAQSAKQDELLNQRKQAATGRGRKGRKAARKAARAAARKAARRSRDTTAARKAHVALEDSATRPSRKSTRKGKNHSRPSDGIERREQNEQRSPETRARASIAKNQRVRGRQPRAPMRQNATSRIAPVASNPKHRLRALSRLLAFAFALAAIAACNNDGNTTQTPGAARVPAQTASAPVAAATSDASISPTESAEKGRHDVVHLLLRAAYEQPLAPARRSELDRLVAELDATLGKKRRAIGDLKTDLAAAIRAGAVDAARMKRHEETISSAVRVHRAKKVDVLDELHAMLDGPGRGAAVSAVRARLAAREGGEAPSLPGARGIGPTGPVDSLKHRLDLLKDELSLDAEQQKQVAALPWIKDEKRALQKIESFRDERQNRAQALLGAFPADAFDAKAVVSPTSQKAPGHVTQRSVAFVSRLVTILKPEQREELASKIDELWTFADPLREHDGDSEKNLEQ